MPHDAETLKQAHEALGRFFQQYPKVFAMVQQRIIEDGPGFLDALALRALDDERAGRLDAMPADSENAPVVFNSATEIGVSNAQADSRPTRRFLRPSHTIGASSSMAGRGGRAFGLAGSLCAGTPIPPCACHPRLASGGGFDTAQEATMPRTISRALAHLFPVFAVPVSTLPTLAEARALAALLVSRGRRAVIQPAAAGFTVAEVA
ncbi:hypothetical protein [Crenobacter cavernae]|uniref:Uncharacterized protein n=1 Tax=Crenobacter cavernae TaxID=2290923 RepID=A0A345Y9T8_9NEIS|nr:hypothetical protein [Crenobacter cavernae]AXK40690.1 hypothetical protein DWG20_15365 [Crenobacter cavernae]